MKKFIFKGVAMFAILAVSVVACKKEETTPLTTENNTGLNVTSDKRMLIFNSSTNYQSIIGNPSETFQKEFLTKITSMEHTTYAEKLSKEKSNNDVIEDEYLSQILNEDLIVQIGDYLYRVNMESDKVFVLPASHIDEYQDLVNENKANKNIRKFSTIDNVIELAESGDAGEKGLFCGESGCGGDNQDTDVFLIPDFPGEYKFWGSATYIHAGIYFCLKAEAHSNKENAMRIYVVVENAWDKVKCGDTHGATSYPWYQNNSTYSTEQIYRKYNSAQPLNGMHMKMKVRCEVSGMSQGSNPYMTYFTQWREIKANSPY